MIPSGRASKKLRAIQFNDHALDVSRPTHLRRHLHAATQLAYVEGLSIGDLASATNMGKNGLYAHFGSKRELQLATIVAARNVGQDVVRRGMKAAQEIHRLLATSHAFLARSLPENTHRSFASPIDPRTRARNAKKLCDDIGCQQVQQTLLKRREVQLEWPTHRAIENVDLSSLK